jgi:hypothetical protein
MMKAAFFAFAISAIGFVTHAEASGYCYIKEGTSCRAHPLGKLTSDCQNPCKIGKSESKSSKARASKPKTNRTP